MLPAYCVSITGHSNRYFFGNKEDVLPRAADYIRDIRERDIRSGSTTIADMKLISDCADITTHMRTGLYDQADFNQKIEYLLWATQLEDAVRSYNEGAERLDDWINKEVKEKWATYASNTWRELALMQKEDKMIAAAAYINNQFEDEEPEDFDELWLKGSCKIVLIIAVRVGGVMRDDLLDKSTGYAIRIFEGLLKRRAEISALLAAFSEEDLLKLNFLMWPRNLQAAVFGNLPVQVRKLLRPKLVSLKASANRYAAEKGYGLVHALPSFVSFCD